MTPILITVENMSMSNFQEQFYQMMTRLRANSRAASTQEDARVTEMINGVLVSKLAKKIQTHLIKNKTLNQK
jgi:hypothetical protein